MKMATEPALHDKKILILDKDAKEVNDRTWSFWETGTTWDHLAIKKWDKFLFYSSSERFEVPLEKYSYKTIRSKSFYAYAKEVISKSEMFEWVTDEVKSVDKNLIQCEGSSFQADHLFDSRIPSEFMEKKHLHPSLVQHFLGWFIETDQPAFDDRSVTIMDYRIKWKDHTSFHYVLPFSPTYALVEFTLFDKEVLKEAEYEEKLKVYIQDTLAIKNFRILEKEIGQIPMSTYPFHHHHEAHLTKIGTGGGWVRPSTGYSFKNAERYASMIVQNLKNGLSPHLGVANNRFRWFDQIFNGVLHERNDLGEWIFTKLYTRHPQSRLLPFLDEQSTFGQDLRIMASMNKSIFPKHFFKTLVKGKSRQ